MKLLQQIINQHHIDESAHTNMFSFLTKLKSNPHFVKFHDLQSSGNGYQAVVELDDGNIYNMMLTINNKRI